MKEHYKLIKTHAGLFNKAIYTTAATAIALTLGWGATATTQVHAATGSTTSNQQSATTSNEVIQAKADVQKAQANVDNAQNVVNSASTALKSNQAAENNISSQLKNATKDQTSAQSAVNSATSDVQSQQQAAKNYNSELNSASQATQSAAAIQSNAIVQDQSATANTTAAQNALNQAKNNVQSTSNVIVQDQNALKTQQGLLNNSIKKQDLQSQLIKDQNSLTQSQNDLKNAQQTQNTQTSAKSTAQADVDSASQAVNSASAAITSDANQINSLQSQIKNVDSTSANNLRSQVTALQKQSNQNAADLRQAKSAVQDAQKTLNNTAKPDDSQLNTAKNAVSSDTKAVSQATNAQKAAQNVVNSLQDSEKHLNKITYSQEWLNTWKELLNKNQMGTQFILPTDPYYSRLKALDDKQYASNAYVDNEADKKIPVVLNANGTLPEKYVIAATQFAIQLLNPIRQALGTPLYTMTTGSVKIAEAVADGYQADNWDTWQRSHDFSLLKRLANEWGTDIISESWAGDSDFAKRNQESGNTVFTYNNRSLNDLLHGVYNAITGLLFQDSGSNYGHTTDLLGTRFDRMSGTFLPCGDQILGVDYEYNKNNTPTYYDGDVIYHTGGFHFNAIPDKNSSYIQNAVKSGFPFKIVDPTSKINQPQYQQ